MSERHRAAAERATDAERRLLLADGHFDAEVDRREIEAESHAKAREDLLAAKTVAQLDLQVRLT